MTGDQHPDVDQVRINGFLDSVDVSNQVGNAVQRILLLVSIGIR
jgi:hypothetical protein